MTKAEITYEPLPHQKRFHQSRAKFRGLIGGIGSGKTLAGIHECIRRALKHPGSVGMIVAPTYPVLRDTVLRTFREELAGSIENHELIKEYRVQDKEIHFINGSTILFRSADKPQRLRGPNIDWFYIDEAAMCGETTWDILIGRIRKGRVDKGWITTTPKGFNWVYDTFEKNDDDRYQYFHASSKDNKYLPDDFLTSLEEKYSGTFYEQEVEGLFRAFEGIVYDNFNPKVHVKPAEAFKDIDEYKDVIVGVDWGYTNPTVFVAVGVTSDRDYHVLDEFYETRLSIDSIAEYAREWQERYDATFWYCDPSEPRFITEFTTSNIPAQEGENDIMPGINKVKSLMDPKGADTDERKLYISERCAHVVDEMQKYRFPESKEGKPRKDKPLKMNDHALDGLRYAVFTYDYVHGGVGRVGGGKVDTI